MKRSPFPVAVLFLLAALLPAACGGGGGGGGDGGGSPQGYAVADTTEDQFAPEIIADGSGGSFIAWTDNRESYEGDIYAQRTDGSGQAQWADDGIAVCVTNGWHYGARLAPDGSGGAFIAWSDGRDGLANGDIYAQRVDSTGAIQWPVNGAVVCSASSYQESAYIVEDGSGGAILVWADNRGGLPNDLYAQRISSSGSAYWQTGGVLVRADASPSGLVTDGAGGAIVGWISGGDVYAQRIDSSGAAQWASTGVAVHGLTTTSSRLQMAADGTGGAVFAWQESMITGEDSVFAQRIDSSGATMWSTDEVLMCCAPTWDDQKNPRIVSDGAGGAIVAWEDHRSYNEHPLDWTYDDIYAQKVDPDGNHAWTAGGVAVITEGHNQELPDLVYDGAGGAIIAWSDEQNHPYTGWDVMSRHLDSTGTGGSVQAVCAAAGDQGRDLGDSLSIRMVPDGSGGAIAVWKDERSVDLDLYAGYVSP